MNAFSMSFIQTKVKGLMVCMSFIQTMRPLTLPDNARKGGDIILASDRMKQSLKLIMSANCCRALMVFDHLKEVTALSLSGSGVAHISCDLMTDEIY